MGFDLIRGAYVNSGLTSATSQAVLAFLALVDGPKRSWWSQANIGKATKLEAKAVGRALADLEARGLIEREQRDGKSGLIRVTVEPAANFDGLHPTEDRRERATPDRESEVTIPRPPTESMRTPDRKSQHLRPSVGRTAVHSPENSSTDDDELRLGMTDLEPTPDDGGAVADVLEELRRLWPRRDGRDEAERCLRAMRPEVIRHYLVRAAKSAAQEQAAREPRFRTQLARWIERGEWRSQAESDLDRDRRIARQIGIIGPNDELDDEALTRLASYRRKNLERAR